MARFTLPAVNRAVLEYQPDMLVVDQHGLAGALAAHRYGLPWATLVTEAMLLPEPVARIGPALAERLARAAAMPVREGPLCIPAWSI